ncbi:hypothetical protein JD844_023295 [Phrynosoma platyrhinos]|uniref:Transposase n=1 Tax=Phrynosoma platyrhinos TaxID=52577 RepID=A0ABQ7SWQ6_PHRPL|nr:hypothetical protein JD844_023295 [Phrynosoma platyrhinos]
MWRKAQIGVEEVDSSGLSHCVWIQRSDVEGLMWLGKTPKVGYKYELMQRGMLEPKDIGFVPDAYTCNQQLERENKYLRKEMESYKFAANKAKEALLKLQKERDFHRMHHKRVVQEKNRLINDIKR